MTITAKLLRPRSLNLMGKNFVKGAALTVDFDTARVLSADPRFEVSGLEDYVAAAAVEQAAPPAAPVITPAPAEPAPVDPVKVDEAPAEPKVDEPKAADTKAPKGGVKIVRKTPAKKGSKPAKAEATSTPKEEDKEAQTSSQPASQEAPKETPQDDKSTEGAVEV